MEPIEIRVGETDTYLCLQLLDYDDPACIELTICCDRDSGIAASVLLYPNEVDQLLNAITHYRATHAAAKASPTGLPYGRHLTTSLQDSVAELERFAADRREVPDLDAQMIYDWYTARKIITARRRDAS
jgi:hypothetical protein